eukprot:Transcript_14643.p1 GENE.Transcript_14643~~Transcript_14643.p1  ORF type:complete len:645 (+),score=306.28 Transcript_14643:48-1937(+)
MPTAGSDQALADELSRLARILILDQEKCQPNMPAYDYLRKNARIGCTKVPACIQVEDGKCVVLEDSCPTCLNRAKRCPGGAVRVVNLPHSLAPAVTHRFGQNAFKLHRLPVPRANQVLGLVGMNGIGKSTSLQVLAGRLKPNLGRYEAPAEWDDVLTYFKGSELQGYFTRMLDQGQTAVTKLQYVDLLPQALAPLGLSVRELLAAKDGRGALGKVVEQLELAPVLGRRVEQLSGGELQRLALALALLQRADVYVFDEPSSYLDVAQRLRAARAIRALLSPDTCVVAVEHDLSLLDYLSDSVALLYGARGAYGIVAPPLGVREGINAFLSGYLPTANLRFREHALSFHSEAVDPAAAEPARAYKPTPYPAMAKALDGFRLRVEPGSFAPSEVIVLLGRNGTGKTTFIRMLAGLLEPDPAEEGGGGARPPRLHASYKPQAVSLSGVGGGASARGGDVQGLLRRRVPDALAHPRFVSEVLTPLKVEALLDRPLHALSGGEQQRVALALALGTPADLYLIDEPSAYLDSEQRLVAARVLKRFVQQTSKTAFVVEHDLMMATYLADRVIVYEGEPAVRAVATAPQPLQPGMNAFLRGLDVSFRRDPETHRPRINKPGSVADKEQKASGDYFYVE